MKLFFKNISFQFISLNFFIILAGTIPTGTPGPATTPNPCGANSTQCVTGTKCIPNFQLCDFTYQCADKSDEANCGKLSPFE